MYKVIIVDDEEIMRDGLTNLVDWEAMGFEVGAQFEDGREAIEYISGNTVDVVFTDIKMTFVSGLDLAAYIVDNSLPIKIILISGHKDFEFARRAVGLNVVEFLLKPISLKDIRNVFVKIKKELDEYNQQMKIEKQSQKKFSELVSYMNEQFVTDLVLGALRNKNEICKRLKLLEIDIDIDKDKCCIIHIEVNDYNRFMKDNWCYGEEALYTAVYNFFEFDDNKVSFYPIQSRQGKMEILAVRKGKSDDHTFSKKMEEQLAKIHTNIKTIMGLTVAIKIGRIFNNIYELARNNGQRQLSLTHDKKDDEAIISSEDFDKIMDREKLLVTHIRDGNFEGVKSLFELFIEELSSMGMEFIQNFCIDMFSMVINKLRDHNMEVYKTVKGMLAYSDIMRASDIHEIYETGLKMLYGITEYMGKQEGVSRQNVITHVKQYIQDNYNRDITLDSAADYVYLSPAYLSRFFKEQTGENFCDYVIQIRLENAVKLLNDGRYKVYEISQMVGYNSIKYFYRLFKKYYGCTPNEYRQKMQILGDDEQNGW